MQSGNAAGPQAHVDKANVASYDYSSVRARPGRFSALRILRILRIRVLRSKYLFCAARLHGRAGRSTDKYGCSWLGRFCTSTRRARCDCRRQALP